MASATVQAAPLFPPGTDVRAYPLNECDYERRVDREPIGASAGNGEIAADGSVEITTSAAGVHCLFGVVDEIQTVTVDATGGTYTLTFEGQETGAIAYDASDTTGGASVRALLEALSNVEAGEVEVSGGPGDDGGTTPYTVVFRGSLGGSNRTAMTSDATNLTGGAGTATIATGTQGSKAGASGVQKTLIFTSAE
jgi:hypothetical protein